MWVACALLAAGALWHAVRAWWSVRRKHRGCVQLRVVLALTVLVMACNALRPRVSEVSVTYTGTMSFERLAILAEIVRW